MFSAIALNTGSGPGTMFGGNANDRISQTARSEAMERILGNVVITNQIGRHSFDDAVTDDVMNEL